MNFKQTILRKIIAPAIVGTKTFRLLRQGAKRDGILMFHGVSKNANSSVRHMQVETFVKLLKLITAEFEIVSLSEVLDGTGKGSKRRLAITFDDGYMNNFEEACPILKSMNLPATFFIITKSLAEPTFTLPIDHIDCIVQKFKPDSITLDQHTFKSNGKSFVSSAAPEDIYAYVIANSERMHEFTAQLKTQFDYDFLNDKNFRSRIQFIDSATLKKLSADPLFTFESHTCTHINCLKVNDTILEGELKESKRQLESLTGTPCIGIAYPYGYYDARTRKLTKELGYKYAYSVVHQLPEDRTDSSIVERIGISNTTTAEVNFININRLLNKQGITTSYQNLPR